MTLSEIVLLITAITGLIGGFSALRKMRGDNAAALATIAAERDSALAAVEVEREGIKQQTNDRIDARVSDELERQSGEIRDLRQEVEKLKAEPNRMKAITRRFVFALHEWARTNGYHDVPWPSDADMAVIAPEFVDLSLTKPKAEVRAAAEEARRRHDE